MFERADHGRLVERQPPVRGGSRGIQNLTGGPLVSRTISTAACTLFFSVCEGLVEGLARIGLRTSDRGGYARPGRKHYSGPFAPQSPR